MSTQPHSTPPSSLTDALKRLNDIDWSTLTRPEIQAMLPTLGMNDEFLNEMPSEFERWFGTGLRFWQYPVQFAGLLTALRERPASSYLEIGCRWGGTFAIMDGFLRTMNPQLQSYAMDLIERPPLLRQYTPQAQTHFIQGNSQEAEAWQSVPDQVDIVFIDGDHDYEPVRNDFNRALKLRPHTIILHDTANDACPETQQFWQELRNVFTDTLEFHDQYPSVEGSYLGIGVIRL